MALAGEMGVAIVNTAGRFLERGGDLMGILTNLNERDVLLLEDVSSVPNRVVEEVLGPAMEEFSVAFVMDKGLNARTMQIPLRPFTCIGTATRALDAPESLRSRFIVVVELQPYSEADLGTIARALAKKRGLELTPEAAALVAQASNRELQQARAILDLAGQPLTGRLEVADISKALAILGHKPRVGGGKLLRA
jgi:Holliday junction DNA helicase RuvB